MRSYDFFYNSLKHTQTLGGIQYDIIYKNMSVQANKIEDYYSIVMINGKDIVHYKTFNTQQRNPQTRDTRF